MKTAFRRRTLLAGAAALFLLAGCGHKHSGPAGTTQPTPTGDVAWNWIGGSAVIGRSGVYTGPTALQVPGSREGSATWHDASGALWIFGGVGYDVAGTSGSLNDLWKYAGGTWTWVSGASTVGQSGVYGTLGTGTAGAPGSTTATNPGARSGAVSWIDAAGNLWLFGGTGLDGNGTSGVLNDLWEYTGGAWVWRGGASTANAKGVYLSGTAVPVSALVPGARVGAVGWNDGKGNLWLFGGGGYDALGNNGVLNDLWSYAPATGLWTFHAVPAPAAGAQGTATLANGYPTYGTAGTAASTNIPGARQSAMGWADASGTLWLFGGSGFDSTNTSGFLNDLWKFVPSTGQWTWVSGQNVLGAAGVYGTLSTYASTNAPGARAGGATALDTAGKFVLFGGQGYDASAGQGYLNDVWQFDPSAGQWRYQAGATVINGYGQYGTQGTASTGNSPGARYHAAAWLDAGNNLWIFGGAGYDGNSLLGDLNDLWKGPIAP